MVDADPGEVARRTGAAIRAARRSVGLTLVQLAEQTQLSQPFLSQAENGKAMASVMTLHRIAQALGTSAHALLDPTPRASQVPTSIVRSDDATRFRLSDRAVVHFRTSGAGAMDFNEVNAEPHTAAQQPTVHAGEELVYVLSGRIEVVVGGERHTVSAGDTLYYAATQPHQWSNDTAEPARFLMVSTPPGF